MMRIFLLIFFVFCVAVDLVWGYSQSPVLDELVEQGKLPRVDERVSDEPVVVEPVNETGKYGGTWRRVTVGTSDTSLDTRMGYEPLVRWDRSGKKIVPGIAKSWEIRDGGKTFIFHLRKGMRWSDGHPFTSEDFVFFYEDLLLNEETQQYLKLFSPLNIENKIATLKTVDLYTLEYHFEKPNGLFLEQLAFRGTQRSFFGPKHYLRRFHPKYADPDELEKLIHEKGFQNWTQFFMGLGPADILANPDLPTVSPFILKVAPPAMRLIAERNPYYWKVDPAGNQLPYIDRVAYTVVQSQEIANFKAMTGDVDFQARLMNAANYTLFMENRHKGNYNVRKDASPGNIVLYINQYSRDAKIRGLLQDKRFRIALSVAINREEIIELIYSGMAEEGRGVASAYDPYYLPKFDKKYIRYEPAKANKLLDELGMKRGRNGMRKMPDGSEFHQILNVFKSESGVSADLWQLVADYYREVGLKFSVKFDTAELSTLKVSNGNSNFWAYGTVGIHWVLDPSWYIPVNRNSYFAPLYGRYYSTEGKKGVKPSDEFQRLVDWFHELTTVVGDDERKIKLGQKILQQWAEQCYTVGICKAKLITIVSNQFKNVPDKIIHDYRIMTPGYIGIEQFYIDGD